MMYHHSVALTYSVKMIKKNVFTSSHIGLVEIGILIRAIPSIEK